MLNSLNLSKIRVFFCDKVFGLPDTLRYPNIAFADKSYSD